MDDELLKSIQRFAAFSDLRLIIPHWNNTKQQLKRENIVQASFYLLEIVPSKLRHLYASLIKEYFDEMQFSGLGKFENFLENIVGKKPFTIKKKNSKKQKKVENEFENPSQPLHPSSIIYHASWKDIGFADGFITIKYNNHYYRKYVEKSKKYLNEIKHYYSFHNIPLLEIEIMGASVKSIINEAILLYHIEFLTLTATHFGQITSESFHLKKWKRYTKQYYRTKLSFLFHKQTLKLLCEYCDPNLPIIPVGEVVKNKSGSIVIHNSFLFPLKGKYGNFLVWESIQESKASYIFSLSTFSNHEIQPIFNYIAGDVHNKRLTLIRSISLQSRLGLKKRVAHFDLSIWELEIRYTSGL